MADEGIIDYLSDPEAAMLQMQMRLLELMGQSELGVESVLEDVLAMPMERRLSFINWLGGSQDPRATRLLLPLLENQSSKVVMATIDALEQLGAVAASQTIPALNYLLTNSSNRQLKQHARAALGRLTMYSAPGLEAAAMEQTLQNKTHFTKRVSVLLMGRALRWLCFHGDVVMAYLRALMCSTRIPGASRIAMEPTIWKSIVGLNWWKAWKSKGLAATKSHWITVAL